MKQARLPFVAALALSGALHAAGAVMVSPHPDALAIEGGGSAVVALLGEAFEDLATGASPVAATQAPPLTAVAVETRTATVTPSVAASPAPPPVLPPAQATDLAALPPVDPALRTVPDPAPPVTASPPPPTIATASDPPVTSPERAPETSPRPPKRPRTLAQAPAERLAAKQSPPKAAGNSDRSARQGAQTGQDQARTAASTAAGSGVQAAQAGTAARANYPGLVLRKIERTRKPALRARGSVVVAFRIAASGAVASARVAQSSGDPALERAALDHIRRAAPFAPPPAGAETEFRFEFVGRR